MGWAMFGHRAERPWPKCWRPIHLIGISPRKVITRSPIERFSMRRAPRDVRTRVPLSMQRGPQLLQGKGGMPSGGQIQGREAFADFETALRTAAPVSAPTT